MKKTNKILSMILALMMIMSAMIIPVNAEAIPFTNLTIVSNKTDMDVGDYIQFDVYVDAESNLSALTVDLVYDADVFSPLDMFTYDMFTSVGIGAEDSNSCYDEGRARYTGATNSYLTEEGLLFTVCFEAIGDAVGSEISLVVSESIDYNNDYVQVFTNTKSINVSPYTNPSLTIVTDKDYGRIGDTVQVDVYASENSDISVLTADLVFDSSVLEPVMMISNGMFNFDEDDNNERVNMEYADGKVRFVGVTPYSLTEGGILFSVLFEVVGTATNSEIWLDVSEVLDNDYNNVSLTSNYAFFSTYSPTDISINEPSRTTIRYKDGIVLDYSLSGTEIPCIFNVVWEWDNDNFDVEVNADNSITIISQDDGYTTFTVKFIDFYGNVVAYDTIEMRSNAGFFQKIGGFFRSIFGLTQVYEY